MANKERFQEIESSIRESFSWRSRPEILSDSNELLDCERDEVEFVSQIDWDKVKAEDLEKKFEFISSLTPEAFCFYLPRVIAFSLQYKNFDLILISSIINTFGSPTRNLDYLDDILGPRLRLLTMQELIALEKWFWLLLELPQFNHQKETICLAIEILELAQKHFPLIAGHRPSHFP